jgi:hypothetical protein
MVSHTLSAAVFWYRYTKPQLNCGSFIEEVQNPSKIEKKVKK